MGGGVCGTGAAWGWVKCRHLLFIAKKKYIYSIYYILGAFIIRDSDPECGAQQKEMWGVGGGASASSP